MDPATVRVRAQFQHESEQLRSRLKDNEDRIKQEKQEQEPLVANPTTGAVIYHQGLTGYGRLRESAADQAGFSSSHGCPLGDAREDGQPPGRAAFAGFPNLSADQQKARVESFDKYDSSLIAHVSAAAQEATRAAMRAEALGAAQASTTTLTPSGTRSSMTKPVKMSVPTFDGKASDSLVFWFREIEIALSAGQIYDARAQVTLALSNLG
ncbi:unnamed protein product [Phytophthora fragariaefolia]|uniref:Unnamed protein product n=1 Tax=Phytophthora fragariaefolia TaxID=1490495 RepID=A0A9W7CVZ9_9STRA|nr:unnamed protein product [Phytophthora fragariaefolia]